MLMKYGTILFLVIFCLINSLFPQIFKNLPDKIVLNLHQKADFRGAKFDSTANFSNAQFHHTADFRGAKFHHTADFKGATFDSTGYFSGATFDSTADFREAQFHHAAYFSGAIFDSTANFWGVEFDSTADFRRAKFNHTVNFFYGQFNSTVNFWGAKFHSTADFRRAKFNSAFIFVDDQFDSTADFGNAQFNSAANFYYAHFNNTVNFGLAQFHSTADFLSAKFDSTAYFSGAKFDSTADFREAQFNRAAYFNGATFDSTAYFSGAKFDNTADFKEAQFNHTVNFFYGQFNSNADLRFLKAKDAIDFSNSIISGYFKIGHPKKVNKYDFSRVGRFGDNAKIIIYAPVELVIQLEKFKYLFINYQLDYYSKKDIITLLKNVSFSGEQYQKERFELDYLFARSTKYQDVSTEYKPYKWYQIHKWPKWMWAFIYGKTMGFGYRPFKLIPYLFIILFGFTFWIFKAMPNSINDYLNRDVKKQKGNNKFSTFINCFYVSASSFFGVRLNKNILTFFEPKERLKIIFIWAFGLLMYVYFLYGAKAGSIANTIKSFFS